MLYISNYKSETDIYQVSLPQEERYYTKLLKFDWRFI